MNHSDDICLFEDKKSPGDWRVEHVDPDGGCFVNIFAGPRAKERATDYLGVLRTGALASHRDGH